MLPPFSLGPALPRLPKRGSKEARVIHSIPMLESRLRHSLVRAISTVFLALPILAISLHAQVSRARADTTAIVRVRMESEGKPVDRAEIQVGSFTATALTNSRGEAELTLPPGVRVLVARKIGFAPDTLRLLLRAGMDTTVTVDLRAQAVELESIVVTTTRGERRVEDDPTRVEILNHEEVEEKTAMSPSGVAHLLSETGGVKIAQTSAAFGTANIRVQGLRGRYTQLLSDGLPLFGLTTEGLGLLQIPPLGLDHVELIKGAASALYGPTALGGVANLIPRRPTEGPASFALLANQTSRNASDAIYYGSGQLASRWGYTVLTSAHRAGREDLDGDGWADLPSYQRVVLRPRLQWASPQGSSISLTSGFTAEDRGGGGLTPGGPFAQERDTRRADLGGVGRFPLHGAWLLTLRASATGEWRWQLSGNVRERERRSALFGEVAIGTTRSVQNVVLGAAFQQDVLNTRGMLADYSFTTPGIFVQHTWTPTEWFGVTSSGRLDLHNEYGASFSPRVSLLIRPAPGWNARLSGGGGTYAPTPFVEETEEIGLSRMRSFLGRLRAEHAWSASADLGGVFGSIEVSGSVYASVISHPAALRTALGGPDSVELVNMSGPVRTQGIEFVAVYGSGQYRATGTYTYQHATEQSPESGLRRGVPLTPNHSAGLLLSWEPKDESGIGIEGFYTGTQPLAENPYRTESRPYVTVGAIARWRFNHIIVFLNSENLTGVRQTKFDPLVRPSPGLGGRWTVDAWAPVEGRIINAGVELRLGGRKHEEEKHEEE